MDILKGIGSVVLTVMKILLTILKWLLFATFQVFKFCLILFFLLLKIVLGIISSTAEM